MHRFTGQLGIVDSLPGSIELGVSSHVVDAFILIVTQTLPFTEHIIRVYEENITDTLTLTQNTDLDVVSYTLLDIHSRCIDDELVLSQEFSYTLSHVYVLSIAQTLELVEPCILLDNIYHPETHYRNFSHSLFLTEALHGTKGIVYIEDIDQTLSLAQSITPRILPIYSVSQTLPFSQLITKTKGFAISQSISQSLSFTQTIDSLYVVLRHYIYREVYQTLSFTESISTSKLFNIRIPQRLDITDFSINNTVFNYSFQDILEFSNDRSLALNAQTILTLPNLSFVRIPKTLFPVTYMIGKHSDIYLPQPNYDDSEALNHVVNVNRSMTGIPYTYVKKSKSRIVTCSFSVNRLKAQELGTFYLKNAAEPIQLVTFDHRLYVGFLTSEPLVYTQTRTNVNDVEITFEGIPM